MAKKEFILQGFTEKTHREAIVRLFDVPGIERVIVSVAFVNRSGVELLEAPLNKHSAKTKAFIGIRNDITSTQGAKHLLDLGVSLFLVDTGSRSVLFHPKLYLVKGATHARLVIGSANLTIGGLNNNIEAGFAIELDLKNAHEKALVEGIEKEFDALAKDYPGHIIPVAKAAELDALQATGRLIDEMTTSPPRPASAATSSTGDTLPRIKLKVIPLRRALAAAKPAAPPPAGKTVAPAKKAATAPPAAPPLPPSAPGVEYELVWESKELKRSDLNIPDGANTNVKGSISLDKGRLPAEVDHRHYFREEVFAALVWQPRGKTVEEAYAKCHLVLKGVSHGEFDIPISHTVGTDSETYRQNNAMTRLRWGPLRQYIARGDLLGRTLALYRDKADPKRFILEID
ncbi:MAG: phospholipase D family protein [Rubrivivax sp.]